MKHLPTFNTFNESVKLDSDEMDLFNRVKKYSDITLLSWVGYQSKKDYEENCDCAFDRKELIQSNYEDILANLQELG